MKDKTFISIMYILIMFFALSSPVIELLGSAGIIDNRLASKNLIVTESYLDENEPFASAFNIIEDVKTGIKNIYSNCIPFYSLIVGSVQKTELALLNISDTFITEKLLYLSDTLKESDEIKETADSLVHDQTDIEITEYETIHQNSVEKIKYTASRLVTGRPNIYKIEPLNILERVEGASTKELDVLMDKQLDYLDRLYNLYPELNYYMYMGTRLQDTEIFSDMIKSQKSTNTYLKRFIDELNPAYKFDYLRIDTPEDRINKLYRSDHHWTTFGAYEGYQQIINMIHEDLPEIGEPVEYNIVKIDGIQWLGSMSSGITDKEYIDDFYVFDINDLPDGMSRRVVLKKQYESYVNGQYPTGNLNYDYYCSYFAPRNEYSFDNDTGHNLLLIGDSYAWAIAPLIAAHFDNTYCYLKPWMEDHVERDYKAIVEDNQITDILILLFSSRLLFGYDSTDFDNFLD